LISNYQQGCIFLFLADYYILHRRYQPEFERNGKEKNYSNQLAENSQAL
jgi:hypothetical protein